MRDLTPAPLLIDAAAVKAAARVDHDHEDDFIAQEIIPAAVRWIEEKSGVLLVPRRVEFDPQIGLKSRMTGYTKVDLYYEPISQIVGVRGFNGQGEPFEATETQLMGSTGRPHVAFSCSGCEVPDAYNVVVTADAGHEIDHVPPNLRHAALMLAVHYYDKRDGSAPPPGVNALIHSGKHYL